MATMSPLRRRMAHATRAHRQRLPSSHRTRLAPACRRVRSISGRLGSESVAIARNTQATDDARSSQVL
jgi:hypothetical protein